VQRIHFSPLLSSQPRRNIHTADNVPTKLTPVSFSVALGTLNIFEAFIKPFLSQTALIDLSIDSVSRTLRFLALFHGI
jgi:hypothetical protein